MTERSTPVWVLATHNAGKVQEIKNLLQDSPVHLRTAGALDLPEPEETGTTYEENAALKAVAAAAAAGLPALSDDSGVEAHALGGDPGVHIERSGRNDGDPAVRRQSWQQAAAVAAKHGGEALCLRYVVTAEQVFAGLPLDRRHRQKDV